MVADVEAGVMRLRPRPSLQSHTRAPTASTVRAPISGAMYVFSTTSYTVIEADIVALTIGWNVYLSWLNNANNKIIDHTPLPISITTAATE